VLVDNQLRAGPTLRERMLNARCARVNLARAQQQAAISRAQLADILGIADQVVEVRDPYWLARHPHRFLPRPPSP